MKRGSLLCLGLAALLEAGCSAAIGLDDLSFDLETGSDSQATDSPGTSTETEDTGSQTQDTGSETVDTSAECDYVPQECLGNIVFADSDLEAVVRAAANLQEGAAPLSNTDPVPAERAAVIPILYAGLSDIGDLSGIECLTNLQHLELHHNQVTDLCPLSHLEKLESLYLESNAQLTDLSPVRQMSSLRNLQITRTGVTNLTSLEDATIVWLEANFLDLASLSNPEDVPTLPLLETLTLNDVGLNDFSGLTREKLPMLTGLALSGNPIADWDFLVEWDDLTGLWLAGTGIDATYLGLVPLTLVELDISANSLDETAFGVLPRLSNLTHLLMAGNAFASIEGLHDKAPNLVALSIRDNSVVPELMALSEFTSLDSLDLENIADLASLDVVPQEVMNRLAYLDAADNDSLTDISQMAFATNLTNLDLWNCQISDLSPLSTLTALEEVNLNDNAIVDLSPLDNTPNIRWLSLQNNQIVDIEPLATNPGLGQDDTLYLDGNPLDCESAAAYIAQLEQADVTVYSDCTP